MHVVQVAGVAACTGLLGHAVTKPRSVLLGALTCEGSITFSAKMSNLQRIGQRRKGVGQAVMDWEQMKEGTQPPTRKKSE